MEDDINGRRPQWMTTSMEDNLNGKQPQWKTTSKDEFNTTSMEVHLNER